MDYSAINYLLYRIKLQKEMFVIGGAFAAALCEPVIAKSLSSTGGYINIYTSSHNFEILKGYEAPLTSVRLDGDDELFIGTSGIGIFVTRGMPAHWVDNSGYQVMDPRPLKHWLERKDQQYIAKSLQDIPFPKRMEGWVLTDEEQAFKEACRTHDWYSDYSDDFQIVKNGKVGLNVLLADRDRIGGKAGEIFAFYANS